MDAVSEIFEYVKSFDGDLNAAKAIQKKFKTLMNAIKEPYALIQFGLDFEKLDARYVGRRQYQEARVEGLVTVAYSHLASSGSTYCTLEELIAECGRIERKIGWKECTPPLILARSILTHFKVEDGKIFARSLYRCEQSIATDLKYISRHGKKMAVAENVIDTLEKSWGIEYDETQKQAFSLFAGVGILTGGPGTGKTTVLKGLMAAWQFLAKTPIVCCAPTGKAAQRMREATGMPAETIHRALGIRPYVGYEGRLKAEESFPDEALVVVDEVSMLDVELAAVLFKAVRNAKGSLILVGDEDQLQSVGPGAVLRDIIASGKFQTCRLGMIHRQEGGALLENIARVKEKQYGMLTDMQTYNERMCIGDIEVLSYIKYIHQTHWDKENPFDIQIYTPLRSSEYLLSTVSINKMLHDIHFPNQKLYCPGEPVVVLRNIYDDDDYLLNGDLGVIEENSDDGIKILVDGESHCVDAGDIELAYATTIHKAQGSSCKAAIIILPEKPSCMVTNRLLYVALTRAEKKAIMLYQSSALRDAIFNINEPERRTRLLENLGGGNVGEVSKGCA